MGNTTCTFDGCETKARARGLCPRHYRWARLAEPAPECTVDGCERKVYARGWCDRHYNKARKSKDWKTLPRRPREERFWAKVDKSGSCWNWTGSRAKTGYGIFTGDGQTVRVHRYSYELLVGQIPAGMHLDHTCHNIICVNPDHLRPVTQKQNNENLTGRRSNNKSGVRGVHRCRKTGKWIAAVGHNNWVYYVGKYVDIAEAEAAVIAKRNELFTHNDLDRVSDARRPTPDI